MLYKDCESVIKKKSENNREIRKYLGHTYQPCNILVDVIRVREQVYSGG
jgi:hypothetical protein